MDNAHFGDISQEVQQRIMLKFNKRNIEGLKSLAIYTCASGLRFAGQIDAQTE